METKKLILLNSIICLASIAFALKYENYWIFFLTGISLTCLLLLKVKWKFWLYFMLPSILFLLLYLLFVPPTFTLSSLFNLIDRHVKIRSGMMDYIDQLYEDEQRDFLFMLIFNQKENKFYKSLIALNIAHLFVISGLHISIFCTQIKKIFKPKYLYLTINLIFTCFIFYLTKFSISILRVLVIIIVAEVIRKKEWDSFSKTCLSGIVMLIIFPWSCTSYSYILTMLCTMFITYVLNETASKWLRFVLINIFTSIIILPITLSFNGKFNVLFFLNNLLFSNAIIVIYYVELLFCWFPFIVGINSMLIGVLKSYITALSQLQAFVMVKFNKTWILISYVFLFVMWNIYEYQQNVYKPRNIIYNKVYENKN